MVGVGRIVPFDFLVSYLSMLTNSHTDTSFGQGTLHSVRTSSFMANNALPHYGPAVQRFRRRTNHGRGLQVWSPQDAFTISFVAGLNFCFDIFHT
jgi:hypothetical protein